MIVDKLLDDGCGGEGLLDVVGDGGFMISLFNLVYFYGVFLFGVFVGLFVVVVGLFFEFIFKVFCGLKVCCGFFDFSLVVENKIFL